jgi:hypothetical protein
VAQRRRAERAPRERAPVQRERGVERALANSPLAEALEYSKSPRVSATPKLMTDGWVGTPRRSRSASKRG